MTEEELKAEAGRLADELLPHLNECQPCRWAEKCEWAAPRLARYVELNGELRQLAGERARGAAAAGARGGSPT